MINSVLFDLDGVLVDACEWHYLSLNKALLEVVGYEISRRDHESKFNGLPTKVKLGMLNVAGGDFDKVWRLKQDYTVEVIKENGKRDDVKIELLSFLRENGIKVACVTNSIRETATLMLEVTGQFPYIDLLISNEDVVNSKPSPDPYNKAIDVFAINPKLSVAVEDSPKGIESASLCKAGLLWKVDGSHYVTKSNFIAAFGGFLGVNK